MADIMMRFDIVIGPICNGSKSFDSWLIFFTLKAAVRLGITCRWTAALGVFSAAAATFLKRNNLGEYLSSQRLYVDQAFGMTISCLGCENRIVSGARCAQSGVTMSKRLLAGSRFSMPLVIVTECP